MRECNGCTLCCRVLGVKEIKKPPNTPCQYCIKEGCDIYPLRPVECADFDCLWLMNEGVPEDLKPSLSHVVMSDLNHDLKDKVPELLGNEQVVVVHTDPEFPNAYKEGRMALFLNGLLKQGVVIIRVTEKEEKIYMKWGTVEQDISIL